MEHDEYMKLVAQTVREAGMSDQEHSRLWSDLRKWAIKRGCSTKMSFDIGHGNVKTVPENQQRFSKKNKIERKFNVNLKSKGEKR